jgi:hypothetical protein
MDHDSWIMTAHFLAKAIQDKNCALKHLSVDFAQEPQYRAAQFSHL